MADVIPRSIRVVDFTADSLEAEAARLPASERAQADSLRVTAEILRKSNNPRLVWVWEEQPSKASTDFIKPDPASHD